MVQHVHLFDCQFVKRNIFLFQYSVKFYRVLNFSFYHPIGEINILCSIRTAED